MKSTDHFKKTILAELESRAKTDSLFRDKFCNPEKNIDDCMIYILNTVQKSGCNGFHDDEIYSMAVHYYDEDSIEIGKPIDMKVVVNHSSSPKEIKQEVPKEEIRKPIPKKSKKEELTLSLF